MDKFITLTTDFGLSDPFAGTMKGVIADICPDAGVIDLTHGVEAFNILDGAVKLWQGAKYFPAGTIHVVVVDPGVGTERRAVLAGFDDYWFVAPDNGVLTWVLAESQMQPEVWLLENRDYFLKKTSNTFHGRDIFAPAAAHLANKAAPETFGRRLTEPLVRLPELPAAAGDDGVIRGRVLLIDRFGNLLTNVRGSSIAGSAHIEIAIGSHVVRSVLTNYAAGEPGVAFAIVGSSGLLEIAVSRGNAAEALGVKRGDEVVVRM